MQQDLENDKVVGKERDKMDGNGKKDKEKGKEKKGDDLDDLGWDRIGLEYELGGNWDVDAVDVAPGTPESALERLRGQYEKLEL